MWDCSNRTELRGTQDTRVCTDSVLFFCPKKQAGNDKAKGSTALTEHGSTPEMDAFEVVSHTVCTFTNQEAVDYSRKEEKFSHKAIHTWSYVRT